MEITLDAEWALLNGVPIGPYSKSSGFCFNPDGPWEWLSSLPHRPSITPSIGGTWVCAVSTWDGQGKPPPPIVAQGSTIFEAITACAVKVFKVLSNEAL